MPHVLLIRPDDLLVIATVTGAPVGAPCKEAQGFRTMKLFVKMAFSLVVHLLHLGAFVSHPITQPTLATTTGASWPIELIYPPPEHVGLQSACKAPAKCL